MSAKVANVLDLIGDTPLVKLNRLSDPNGAAVYGKLESNNPGGSVKDRIALAMIEVAEETGALKPGGTIIEPTSGNTGIGLAMVGAVRGYRVILTMPETMSQERIAILKAYGAEVVLTDGAQGMNGAIAKAEQLLAETPNAIMPQQFTNEANPEVHRRTTAEEIWEATEGKLDAFVAGVGTGGTITGVGEALKARLPELQVIAVEPAASPVLSGGEPGPHKLQGIGAGFVPDVLNLDIIDRVITVTDNDAFTTARTMGQQEGLSVGISAGAAVWAALQVTTELGPDQTVVVILPDGWEKYVSLEQDFEN